MGNTLFEHLFSKSELDILSNRDFSDEIVLLNERRFRIKQASVSNKHIRHWEKEGLIDVHKIPSNNYRTFNVVELLWLSTVAELRNLGLPYELIKSAKSSVFAKGQANTLFEIGVLKVIFSVAPVFLIIDHLGNASMVDDLGYNNLIEQGKINKCLTININELIKENFPMYWQEPIYAYQQLSDREKELIAFVKSGKFLSVTIHFKDQEIERLEGMEQIDVSKHLHDLFKEGKYQDVVVKLQDGKKVSINRVIKKKL